MQRSVSAAGREPAMAAPLTSATFRSTARPRAALAAVRTLVARCLVGAGIAFAMAAPASAEQPTTPVLRIDPGEHTATINRISTDAAGRWLLTTSHDKTARVWDLAKGRLLTTLRPPIGTGDEGKLFAGAMSPDGSIVVIGGWTDDDNAMYVFDRASGRMLRTVTGLANVVLHLAFSPDGRYLVAGLGGSNGVRVFDAADGRVLGEDTDFAESCYGAQFSADSKRLVATGLDGFVRTYRVDGGKLVRLAKRAPTGGKFPWDARFSPDGKRIAVGFNDGTSVDVVDAGDLHPLFSPDTAGLNGNLSTVAWSRDGAWLYAAGLAQKDDNQKFIRRWPMRGNRAGAPEDWPVSNDTIMDLAPQPDDRIAFSSGGPRWGVIDGSGRRQLYHAPSVADLRNNRAGLMLSADGMQVKFAYEYGGESPIVFDTRRRAFLPADTAGLASARTTAPGLEVTDWESGTSPKVNGIALELKAFEGSRSLAIPAKPTTFVLGTDWYLRGFDRNGKQIWQQSVPGAVWAVNISKDGRWIVAAFGDGTIRWHRAEDGVEQMAFYPHPDQRRWVLWTPSGYYDSSAGAEDLIGWHVNNGKDRASDYFSASRFRDRFYRPDVLSRLLDTASETEAVKLANAETGRREQSTDISTLLPPVVELVTPAEGERFRQSTVQLRYRVRTAADAPVTSVKILVDGRPLETARGLTPKPVTEGGAREYRLDVTLPERDLTLSVIAENKHGAGEARSARLAWAGAKAETFVAKPRLYVLAIGVSNYEDKSLKLNFAAKDARDFAAAFKQQAPLYREIVTKVLADATGEQLLDGLDWLRAEVTAKDVGVLVLAGHGVNDADGDYYFLPRDANTERLRRTGVSYLEVKKTLAALPGKTLAFIDTCHAGNVMGARRGAADINAVVNDLTSAENGVVVFASSTGRQFALEQDAWGNGAFTKALVEGLTGKADYTRDGAVTINELDTWLADRVKQLTKNQQTPTTTKPSTVQDFPVVVVK